MKTLDLRNLDYLRETGDLSLIKFPDGQPHVKINSNFVEGDRVRVVCPLRSSDDLLYLLELSNSLDTLFCDKVELVIPYLLGARSDRVMRRGDSLDLKVIADMINYCGFKKVTLFDVHSTVATTLIKNSVDVFEKDLIQFYKKYDAVLICPDEGASKKIGDTLKDNPHIKDMVSCMKKRDLSNGKITLKVYEPEKCKDRNCIILDDICDGGATFLAIADQIQPKHLTLAVTHGIFSKGFSELDVKFDEIITTDSYRESYSSKKVKVVPIYHLV